ncbi:MAG TPA: SIMPL domain-containing protein [Candidatus Tectomicrobia bacterium]|nr:SIMPL domain-containing protein [Candidatus Tectomicrobia bacterium]
MAASLLPIVLAMLVTACTSLVPANPTAPEAITVTGTGEVSLPPDLAVLHVGAEARAPALGQAGAEVDRRMRAVLERLRALGVQDRDVRTIVYAVEPFPAPRRPGEDDTPRIAGYRVTSIVEVRTRDLAGLDRLVEAAAQAGANIVRNLHFTLADRAAAEAEARAAAARDAEAKARQLATAAGVRLGRLLSLTESGPARPLGRAALASTPAVAGPVETGLHEVVVTVEARYSIEGERAR